jgi:hypothetical protein
VSGYASWDEAIEAETEKVLQAIELDIAKEFVADTGNRFLVDNVLVYLFGCTFCGTYPARKGHVCPEREPREMTGLLGLVPGLATVADDVDGWHR